MEGDLFLGRVSQDLGLVEGAGTGYRQGGGWRAQENLDASGRGA